MCVPCDVLSLKYFSLGTTYEYNVKSDEIRSLKHADYDDTIPSMGSRKGEPERANTCLTAKIGRHSYKQPKGGI